MTIKELFDSYTDKVSSILSFKNEIHRIFDDEFKRLHDFSDEHKNDLDKFNKFTSTHYDYIYSPKDCHIIQYSKKEGNVETLKKNIFICKNKQYQWILATLYEAYEAFLQAAYAYLGLIDHSCWSEKDLDKITSNDLRSNNYEYFLRLVRDKKGKPESILKQFRKVFPLFEKYELINGLNINLKFRVLFIEKLRHHIVHTNGIVNNIKKLTEEVIDKTGQYNNKQYINEMKEFINDYFYKIEDQNQIMLIERRVVSEFPLFVTDNRLDQLSNDLLSGSYLLMQEIENKEKNA
jgi:hypothetical protein